MDLLFGPLKALFVQNNRSDAVFGQATLNIGDAFSVLRGLSITGGLRYTWEKSATSVEIIPSPVSGGSVSSRYPSYTVSVDQSLFDNAAHVYVTVRDAFKSGGANAGLPGQFAFRHLRPGRELQDVEVGLKSEFRLGVACRRASTWTPTTATTAIFSGPRRKASTASC